MTYGAGQDKVGPYRRLADDAGKIRYLVIKH